MFQEYQPQLISTPIIISITRKPCGRRLYDEVYAIASNILQANTKYNKPSLRWWERKDWKSQIKKNDGIYRPFVLKTVDRKGYACSKCHWTQKCSGCLIEPTDAPIFIDDLINNSFLAIEWNNSVLQENYNQTTNEVVEHSTVFERQIDMDQAHNYSTLEEALIKFHQRELLENQMNCNKCKQNQPHTKRLEVFKLPPVLIIQLKRFRQVGSVWRKLHTLIDFPIHNLNMEQYTPSSKFTPDHDISTQYDLHGIVNHYGTLGFGHYVSFVKNHFDQTWYKYDDNTRQEVKEEQLEKESAYLLFYIRKDVVQKDLNQLLPNIETSFFPGKPVNIKGTPIRQGFIMEVLSPDTFVVKIKDEGTPKRLMLAELMLENDKNEIQYNQIELKDIEAQKSKKLHSFQQQKVQISSKHCCQKALQSKKEPQFIKEELSETQIKIASEQQVLEQKNKPDQKDQEAADQEGPQVLSENTTPAIQTFKRNRIKSRDSSNLRNELNSARANTSHGHQIEKVKSDLSLQRRPDDNDVNRSHENLLLRRSGISNPN